MLVMFLQTKRVNAYSTAVTSWDVKVAIGTLGVVIAVPVLACSDDVVTGDGDRVFKIGTSGWLVREDGDPSLAVAVASTEDERCPVTSVRAGVTPDASILWTNTSWVDVVLSRGKLALPHVVALLGWAGKVLGRSSVDAHWDGLTLGTRVVGTADGDLLVELVDYLNVDLRGTRDTESLESEVGEVELATLAKKTTNGLVSDSLKSWPLRLLISSWAGVGAESTLEAAAAVGGVDVVVSKSGNDIWVLNTRPAVEVEVVQGNGTVVRWELGAVDFAAWEVSASSSAAAGAAGV